MQKQKQYTQYPNRPGIIIVRDRYSNHLFTMSTDSIRARVQAVDTDHVRGTIKQYPAGGWSEGRVRTANEAGVLVFEYVEMPNTERSVLKQIASAMDSESLSKAA